MARVTLEGRRGVYAVGPLLFHDGVFEQDGPLTPLQARLAAALHADVEDGGEGSDEPASGRHAADEPADATPVDPGAPVEETPAAPPAPEEPQAEPEPVAAGQAAPEDVEAAATAEGSISTVASSTDGSEVTDAATPAAEQQES